MPIVNSVAATTAVGFFIAFLSIVAADRRWHRPPWPAPLKISSKGDGRRLLDRPRCNRSLTGSGRRLVAERIEIGLTVNGERVSASVEPRTHLADFLRDGLGLTGTHLGCEHGQCGACTLRLDGRIVRGCLVFAVQAEGGIVETIEGLSASGEIADLQQEFIRRNALQCGYCTPGMLIAAQDLLRRLARPGRAEIREQLSGNYCRCTGYQAIIDAVEAVAGARAAGR
jgi:carbon-monoxide dehydrogenase small subunit